MRRKESTVVRIANRLPNKPQLSLKSIFYNNRLYSKEELKEVVDETTYSRLVTRHEVSCNVLKNFRHY